MTIHLDESNGMEVLAILFASPQLVEPFTDYARRYLRERGYHVQIPHEWKTPGDYCAAKGISLMHLSRCLSREWRPKVDVERGSSGRLLQIASNDLFDAFVLRNKPKNPKPKTAQA